MKKPFNKIECVHVTHNHTRIPSLTRSTLLPTSKTRMPNIFVFNEFAAYEKLCNYVDCPVLRGEPIRKKSDDAPNTLFQTNIKIFFNPKDTTDQKHAYRIKQTLEEHSIASFVTDQLTVATKQKNGEISMILLPKDRIIMKLC